MCRDSASRDAETWSHSFGVPSDRYRSMLWEILAARCAVGRLAVRVVFLFRWSQQPAYI